MTWLEWFEFLSYAVTVVGLPFAIAVFMHDRRRARVNEQEEIYQRLADEYASFLKLVLSNADLRVLRRAGGTDKLTEEQEERRFALFNILVSLFERAYMLVYEERMDKQTPAASGFRGKITCASGVGAASSAPRCTPRVVARRGCGFPGTHPTHLRRRAGAG